jgi:hypothetical protein
MAATILTEEEVNDLLVYYMSNSATDIFKKRKDELYWSSLIGRYLMYSEMKSIQLRVNTISQYTTNTAAANKHQLLLPVVTRLLRRDAQVKGRMPNDAAATA